MKIPAQSGDGIVVRKLSPWGATWPSVIFGRWNRIAPCDGDTRGDLPQLEEPVETTDVLIAQVSYAPHSTSKLIRHNCEEVVLALEGAGAVVTEGGGALSLRVGEIALIRAGEWHAMKTGPEGLGVVFWFPAGSYPPTEHRV